MALEQGKNVYAVPGRLTDRLSDGCNMLIRQGAGIALAPKDLLAELKILENRKALGAVETSFAEGTFAEKRKNMLDFLDYHPKSADEILEEIRREGLAMELPELFTELIELCMEGKAAQAGGSFFFRTGPGDL